MPTETFTSKTGLIVVKSLKCIFKFQFGIYSMPFCHKLL